MSLIFLRHTTPDVAKGMCYGATDLDVTANFVSEAEVSLKSLPHFQNILVSPLQRCQKLARHISLATGIDIQTRSALIEMDFGGWEMVPWNDVPRPELDEWAADFLNARPHGGESVAELRNRVEGFLQSVEPHSLIVTHSGVIRAAAEIYGHPDGWDIKTGYGEWVQFDS